MNRKISACLLSALLLSSADVFPLGCPNAEGHYRMAKALMHQQMACPAAFD